MASTCPFSYSGSKSEYTEFNFINTPVVDLFGGGGGFWSNVKSTEIVVNDISRPLVRFQSILYRATDEQYNELVLRLYNETMSIDTREAYEALRKRFNDTQDPVLFYAVLSCCHSNMVRFNLKGGFNQTWGKRKFNKSMEDKLTAFRNRINIKSIKFNVGSFDSITDYKDFLFFADPPYLITSAAYNLIWGRDEEYKLYNFLKDRKFLLTNFLKRGDLVNDILEKNIQENNWLYSSLRNGKMKAQKDQESTYEEVFVTNDKDIFENIKMKRDGLLYNTLEK